MLPWLNEIKKCSLSNQRRLSLISKIYTKGSKEDKILIVLPERTLIRLISVLFTMNISSYFGLYPIPIGISIKAMPLAFTYHSSSYSNQYNLFSIARNLLKSRLINPLNKILDDVVYVWVQIWLLTSQDLIVPSSSIEMIKGVPEREDILTTYEIWPINSPANSTSSLNLYSFIIGSKELTARS